MFSRRDGIPHWPLHVVLVLFTLFALYPILWVISIAFSGRQSLAITTLPESPTAMERVRAIIPWPETWSASNFTSVMTEQPFGHWLFNSAVISLGTTVVGVFLACTAAYAFSRFKFVGQRTGMMAFLVSQMFPGTLMLIPLYIILVQWLGLGSSRLGLMIVYATTSIPFSVWMLKGYFDTIPKDLEEAALMEGASVGKIFWTIILPLAKPAVAVTALFSFMTAWNEFMFALFMTSTISSQTIPVIAANFATDVETQVTLMAAAGVLAVVPPLVLVLICQRLIVQGMAAGSVKG